MIPVIGIAAAFIIAVLVLNRWHQFGFAMLAGSFIVAVTGGFTFMQALQVFWAAVSDPITLELTATVVLINVLGHILKQTGVLEKLVSIMLVLLKDVRLLVMAIPAIIGALPVMGGAVMSAPLVAQTGDAAGLSPERQTAANVFYRHLIYPVFPLYASLILTQDLSGLSYGTLVRHQLLPVLVALAVSVVVIFRGAEVRPKPDTEPEKYSKALGRFLYYAAPIYIVVILVAVGVIGFIPAVAVGIVGALLQDVRHPREALDRAARHLLPGLDWNLALAVISVMIFRFFVEGSGAMSTAAAYLGKMGVPVLLLAVIVPVLTGLATGSSLAAVGILYPIFIPLLPAGTSLQAFVSLIFISAMVGYVSSPVHMCLVLTQETCRARFTGVYPYLLPPLAAMLGTALILALI